VSRRDGWMAGAPSARPSLDEIGEPSEGRVLACDERLHKSAEGGLTGRPFGLRAGKFRWGCDLLVFRYVVAAAAAIAIAGCGSRLHGLLPGTNNGVSGERVSTISPDSANGARSSDSSFIIRSIHIPGVTPHRFVQSMHASGAVIQEQFSTPVGLLTVLQHPVAVPSSTISVDAEPLADVAASGTTSRGCRWLLLRGLAPKALFLRIRFPDSDMDTWIPEGVSSETLRSLLEGVY